MSDTYHIKFGSQILPCKGCGVRVCALPIESGQTKVVKGKAKPVFKIVVVEYPPHHPMHETYGVVHRCN